MPNIGCSSRRHAIGDRGQDQSAYSEIPKRLVDTAERLLKLLGLLEAPEADRGRLGKGTNGRSPYASLSEVLDLERSPEARSLFMPYDELRH